MKQQIHYTQTDHYSPGVLHSLLHPLVFVLLLWVLKVFEKNLPMDIRAFTIIPQSTQQLWGILTFPLFHKDPLHLFNNSLPLLLLGTLLFYLYEKIAFRVLFVIYLGSGIVLWFIGRPSYHLGASGIVYGLVAFHFFSGLIRRDKRSIGLSLLVTFLYGSFVWGVMPLAINKNISWEGHLAGALMGTLMAFVFRKTQLSIPLHATDQKTDREDDWEDDFYDPADLAKQIQDLHQYEKMHSIDFEDENNDDDDDNMENLDKKTQF